MDENERQARAEKEQLKDTGTTENAARMGATPGELTNQVLVIHEARHDEEGDFWTPGHGSVCIPDGWEFLPRGDAFITRQVKKGPHWVLKGQYNRRGGYTPVYGVYAPADSIKAAQATAKISEARRQQSRQTSRARREKEDEKYRQQFEQACLQFLDFAPEHNDLAREIAAGTAAWACEKSSGRVGRTSRLALEKKATLAVRAHIRHRYTDYESSLPDPFDSFAQEDYPEVKAEAQCEVDWFLAKHRAEA